MTPDPASRDDEIDWDVVPPPPTTAFDRVQTRTVQVVRSGRRRLPESRRTAALVAGLALVMALALAATWWVRRPPPGADHDLLVRLAATSESFRPSYVTTSRAQAESYVADVFGWAIGLPEIPGFRLAGVGEAALSPQLSVPAVRYDGPDAATVVVFAYDYAFLEESSPALDLPEATYAQLAEPDPVDTRRLGDAALVSWRRRAVVYTAVTESDEAFELLGRAVAAPPDAAPPDAAPPDAAPGLPTDSTAPP